MASHLLSLRHVYKGIAGKFVLSDISLEIESGRVIAIVGRNGSGKSTLLKIISGLGGFDKGQRLVERNGGKISIGYVPERFPKLSFNAADYLRSMGRMHGILHDELAARIEEFLELFGLDPTDRRTMRNYSKGMLQKVNLIQAMLVRPELLLLDEPFSGLDHASQEELVAALLMLKQQGQAIIMTTHEPSFVERVADIKMQLQNGRLNVLEDRALRIPMKRLKFELPDTTAFLPQMNMLSQLKRQGRQYVALVERRHSDSILRAILEAGGSILHVEDERTGNAS